MTDAWTLLVQGKILEAILSVYTTPLGAIFYFWVLILTLGMIFLKSQSLRSVGVTFLLISASVIPFIRIGLLQGILFFFLASTIALLIYLLVKRR